MTFGIVLVSCTQQRNLSGVRIPITPSFAALSSLYWCLEKAEIIPLLAFIMAESPRTWFGFPQLGRKVICLGESVSGQRQVFWPCGSLDAGVAAGTDVRSDPCAVSSTSQ